MRGYKKTVTVVPMARILTASALLLAIAVRIYGLFFRVGVGSLVSGRSNAVALVVNILLNAVPIRAVWKEKKWGYVLATLILLFDLTGDAQFVMKQGLIGSGLEQMWTVIRLVVGGAGSVTGLIGMLWSGRGQRARVTPPSP